MKNMIKRLVSLVMIAILAIGISSNTTVSAKTYTIGGNGKTSSVFTFKTGSSVASTKLTFKQNQGVYEYQNNFCGTSTCKSYGNYMIYVQESNGKNPKAYYCKYKSSTTVTLKAKTTYKISVVPTQNSIVYRDLKNAGKLWRAHSVLGFNWNNGHWKTYSTWTINTQGSISGLKNTKLNTSVY